MKIKAIVDFYDLQLEKNIKAGEEYDVSEERAKELTTTENRAKKVLAELIEAPTPIKRWLRPHQKKKKTEDK